MPTPPAMFAQGSINLQHCSPGSMGQGELVGSRGYCSKEGNGDNDDTREECSSQPGRWARSGCSARGTLGCQSLLLSQTPCSLCIPHFSQLHRCAPCLSGMLLQEYGERAGAGVAAAFREEESSSLLFFPFLVCSRLTPTHRSSCLDEYLPKSLCFLAVSLQKAQHHLYGNGRLSQKCFGSNQLN